IIKDTIVSIPTRKAIDTLEFNPVYNALGKQIQQTQTIYGKGMSVALTKLPNGKIAIAGTCDSMAILIAGLSQEIAYYKGQYDSLNTHNIVSGKYYIEQKTKTTYKQHYRRWIALAVVIVFI